MKDKINIAELLKDCPSGMELDCTMYENCTYAGIEDVGYIDILINTPSGCIRLTKEGCYIRHDDNAKCVIFPKGKTTWEGFVPPYQFKDGDVISDSLGICIFKGEGVIKGTVNYYCGICDDHFVVKNNKCNPDSHYGNIIDYRLATKEEKQKLFNAIKDNSYKWNEETKTLEKLLKFKVGDKIKKYECIFIIAEIKDNYYLTKCGNKIYIDNQDEFSLVPNKFDITTLKPFDKVLVRDYEKYVWRADFYSHYSNNEYYKYICVGHTYRQCIPYNEETANLINTTNDCDEYYKTWEK